jgi:transposase
MVEIRLPLDIESLEIISQSTDTQGSIIFEVRSKKSHSTCHKCGKAATKRYGKAPKLKIKHLPILDTPVFLVIRPIRYECEHCDDHPTTTEQYDWCDRRSSITKGLEKYIMRNLIHSTIQDVSRKDGVSYETVESALDRQVNQEVDWSDYDNLATLGIDEISMKKGYQDFVTIVSARPESGPLSVIAVLPNRLKATVLAFFLSIPKVLRSTVKTVCTDMYDGFVQAATEVFGAGAVVIDRYHVAKLYREPLDALRTKEMERLKAELPGEEYAKLAGMIWILRKKHECLSDADKTTLKALYKHSPKLKSAHGHALRLTHIFNTKTNRKAAVAKLNRWITRVRKSGVTCFNKFIKTLLKYKSGIANYFKARKNSGFVEGLNNKIKVAKRRCYGLLKTTSLFQRLQLDLIGFVKYA